MNIHSNIEKGVLMHIPDGYFSPAIVVGTYSIVIPLWVYGLKKIKKSLNEGTLPLIGALSAMSFVIMMLNIPIPGAQAGMQLELF